MTGGIFNRPTANQLREQLSEAEKSGAFNVIITIDLKYIVEELNRRDEALRFYANSENYDKDTGAPIDMKPRGLEKKLWKVLDFGDKAREALGEE